MDAVIVVPCFNEAHRLKPEAFLSFSRGSGGASFLFVDDGSADGTWNVVESLARRAPPGRVRTMRLEENRGKGEAVRQGLLSALEGGAEAVGYWDADLSTPLETVPGFLDVLKAEPGIDAVIGVRRKAGARVMERNPLRHAFGRLFGLTANWALGLSFYDTQCGAKIFRSSGLADLLGAPFQSPWIFDIEILLRLRRRRGPGWEKFIKEFPLPEWRNVPPSRVGWAAFARGPLELLHLWRRYGRG